jgi:subtilase family serine protease
MKRTRGGLGGRKSFLVAMASAITAVAIAVPVATADTPPGTTSTASPKAAQSSQHFQRTRNLLQLYASQQAPTTADCEAAFQIACYAPFQFQRAYNLNPLFGHGLNGNGRTIAIVDSFGSPTIAQDLAQFDADFGLPAPPKLRVIHPAGAPPPFDPNDDDMVGWAYETTLDVEWAHALAPGAKILLVETPVSETEGLTGIPEIVKSENYVINHNLADVISQSFGATEETFPSNSSIYSQRSAFTNAEQNGVSVLAASGDSGPTDYQLDLEHLFTTPVVGWPSSDPLVTSVGGTQLHLDANGNRTAPDNVWNDSFNPNVAGPEPQAIATGSGDSHAFIRPFYQDAVRKQVGGSRGAADISMSAACDGGVLVYVGFTTDENGYHVICGTSEATPEFSSIVAIADQAAGRRLGLLNPTLYKLGQQGAKGLVDVTQGDNTVTFTQDGQTYTIPGSKARPGYDMASGNGTINANALVRELARGSGG